jgi:two-component system OmpR family response regulator
MPKILIVEDDEDLALVVREHLAAENYSADVVNNGRDAISLLQVAVFDLIILDWNLPHHSGLEVLSEFRASGGKTPIIMLTGKKEIVEKEQGLDTGADDYLTKPFSLVELSARVRALLRRPDTLVSKVLSVNGIQLDPIKYSVEKDGSAVHLQPQDFSLLEFLMRHPDQPFTPAALLIRVWGTNSEATVESVRSAVKRLRQKLDDADSDQSFIENIPRIGYRLNSR